MQIKNSLIKSCVSQNRNAQKQLYELLLPYLRAVASRYLRDTSYVKDVLQESFVKIFRNMEHYDPNKAPLKQWAAKITINNCLNYNKRVIGLQKEEFIIEKHQTITVSELEKWSNEDLLYLLKKMPEQYFEVFNLFVIDGYSHQEIADMLKISEPLSRKRLSRAKSWVKKTFIENPDMLTKFNVSLNFKN